IGDATPPTIAAASTLNNQSCLRKVLNRRLPHESFSCTGSVDSQKIRGGFAGIDCSSHEALPLGEMLAGKQHATVGLLQNGADAEPLPGAVERIGTSDPVLILPSLS